ncbi:zinc finger CCCH domain-containing protein 22-like isoform X1 [Populus nigra]|uniref:zinc finger CCCH domain-containing protein 22-like isoform X1 n=1 Tax=Populus nigra TaxID=3691 RepID=UPI002B2713E9|nr:zinc finger CCCH domain-containing protein 22-like isoform X1 [Populus nigra]XP_061960338.1 zinc finger CCCH domain-containing protein 22-like isoform X1 [Populus nigra]
MDGYEATRIVFSRIQNLDPENASKIMGLLLIQDHGEKEMIRLAFGPEALVHSVILKARKELGLCSPTNPSKSPSPPSPLYSSNPITISRQNSSSSTSRLGFNIPPSLTIPNPSSNFSSSWSDLPNPDDLISPNGSSLNPASAPFYANGVRGGGESDLMDEFQLQDQLSFLNDNSAHLGPKSSDLFYSQLDALSSPTGASDSMMFPSYWGGSVHRRSCSVSDVLGSEDPNSGFGWRPCLYFARGYCKNGSNCRFVHGGLGESDGAGVVVGSPNGNNKIDMMDQCHELLRSKSAQQQRLAAASQLMGGSAASFPYSPKSMNFLLQQQQNDSQRAAAAALMMGEDMHKFARSRLDRNDLINPASRQIYLTFPADSTFREEDVSNYFSIYGPVQDVRIPYQQKRMFGFVTFVYPETVKIILAKGNPHFVCDARVLVKPYKEKGKVPDKYRKQQQQQVERGEFSPCGTPTGLDSRDPFDLQLGARMFYNTQDMLWRRKLEEQADLQQALELQSRRLMSLQLLDVKKHHHRALSTGSPVPSPTHSPNIFNQSLAFPPLHSNTEVPQENCSSPMPAISVTAPTEKQISNANSGKECTSSEENGSGKESSHGEDSDLQESLEHNLPDSPFASPTKGSGDYYSAFIHGVPDLSHERDANIPASSSANNSLVTTSLISPNSSLEMASFKSFNCQMPRFSSGHGAIGMYANTDGPTCPVGI